MTTHVTPGRVLRRGPTDYFMATTRKTHDTQRRDRILCVILDPEIGLFSPDFVAISSYIKQKTLEKGQESTLDNSIESSGENSPKLQVSISCQEPLNAPFLNGVFSIGVSRGKTAL